MESIFNNKAESSDPVNELATMAIAAILALSWSSDALARERPAWRDDPLGDRFWLGVGLYRPTLDTQVRRDTSDGILGTVIDFESTLGMKDRETLPSFLGFYRVGKRHRVLFQYFRLERLGTSVNELPVRFGDTVFPANLPISSYFDVDVYSVAYSYSLIHDKKIELAISVGVDFQDVEMGIAGDIGPGLIEEDTSVFMPLPTFGGSFDYAISDKWIFKSVFGVFGLDFDLSDDAEFSGSILQVNAGIAYKAFKNVGFGLEYAYFRTDIDLVDADWIGALKYKYRGPVLSASFYF